jgi:transposase
MGINVLLLSTIRWWVRQFKQEEVGEASLCDTARLGRPVTATDKSHQECMISIETGGD